MATTTKNVGRVTAGFGTPTASVDANVGTPQVTVTASGPDTAKVFDFEFENMKGETGAPAGFGTPTASIDNTVGTPKVTINSSGPNTAKVFNFQFEKMKGEKGDRGYQGYSIGSIDCQGAGLSGRTDTYHVKLNDSNQTEIGTFVVYNGLDGKGSGDMKISVYDTNNNGKVDCAEVAESIEWTSVQNKPIGKANGLAELDSNGLVPSNQLPSFVDDVIEGYLYNSNFYQDSTHTSSKIITGETGKVYVDLSTNKTYRWSGSTYVTIGSDLAIGETSSTAYRGDRGKTAYDHSQSDSVHCTEWYSTTDVEDIWNGVMGS